MDMHIKPQPVAGYEMEELDGEFLLFHPTSQTSVHSNQSGLLIWKLADGSRSVGEIVDLLKAAYPEAADEIEHDVEETILAFKSCGAFTWEDPA
jgi:hypothetical protein